MTPAPSQPTPAPSVLTCRTPEDVVAAIPVLLGFEPAESVVMLTFGGRETFHARVDLPPRHEPEAHGEMRDLLLDPVLAHQVPQVVFVAYSSEVDFGREVLDRLEHFFEAAGVEVAATLVVSGRCWFVPGGDGVPFEVSAHPFRVESVLRGQVVSGSREELAARLRPSGDDAGVKGALRRALPASTEAVEAHVATALEVGRFTDDVLAQVVLGLTRATVRDGAWCAMTSATASAYVTLWTDAVQRCPRPLVGGPAAVLALASWLAGNGALAWCAIDLCLEHDPDNTLAGLVGELLTRAVPPSRWAADVPARIPAAS